jgi:tripartite-type tricarboxylate transporter receptor subunit TctC
VSAQPLPEQRINIVAPAAAGTATDQLTRLLGQHLKQHWGQTIAIDNKPGAAGTVGTQAVARSQPDGQTLLLSASTFAINAVLYPGAGYDPVADFAPVAKIAVCELVLAVTPALKVRSVADYLELARARPGKMTFASPGVGSPQHLFMEQFALVTGTRLLHLPARDSDAAVQDVVEGRAGAMAMQLHTALELERFAKLKLLAICGPRRSPRAIDVPILAEEGVKGFAAGLWYGLFAPAKTPADVVKKLNAGMSEILKIAAVDSGLRELGLNPAGGSPEALAALLRDELVRWRKVVRATGIKPQ